jgi:hypothetical protein
MHPAAQTPCAAVGHLVSFWLPRTIRALASANVGDLAGDERLGNDLVSMRTDKTQSGMLVSMRSVRSGAVTCMRGNGR